MEGIILLEITSVSYVRTKFPAKQDHIGSWHRLLPGMAFMFVYANVHVTAFNCKEVIAKALAIKSRWYLMHVTDARIQYLYSES